MDLATLLGIIVASGLVFISILLGGPGAWFINYPSLMIVIGGTMGATLINYPMADVVSMFKVTKNAFRHRTANPLGLIPIMIDAGFDYVDPMEVAAGNDLPALRREYGNKVAFGGGIDKREIARGGQHIVREIDRLRPVIESGGYIPSCDHGIPVDVGWTDFVHYVQVLAKATGWL